MPSSSFEPVLVLYRRARKPASSIPTRGMQTLLRHRDSSSLPNSWATSRSRCSPADSSARPLGLHGAPAEEPRKSHGKNRFTSVGRDLTKRNDGSRMRSGMPSRISLVMLRNGRDGITNRLALTQDSRMATTRSFPSPNRDGSIGIAPKHQIRATGRPTAFFPAPGFAAPGSGSRTCPLDRTRTSMARLATRTIAGRSSGRIAPSTPCSCGGSPFLLRHGRASQRGPRGEIIQELCAERGAFRRSSL